MKIQNKIINLNENKIIKTKENVSTSITERHKKTSNYMKNTLNKIYNEENSSINKSKFNEESMNRDKFNEIDLLLEELTNTL